MKTTKRSRKPVGASGKREALATGDTLAGRMQAMLRAEMTPEGAEAWNRARAKFSGPSGAFPMGVSMRVSPRLRPAQTKCPSHDEADR